MPLTNTIIHYLKLTIMHTVKALFTKGDVTYKSEVLIPICELTDNIAKEKLIKECKNLVATYNKSRIRIHSADRMIIVIEPIVIASLTNAYKDLRTYRFAIVQKVNDDITHENAMVKASNKKLGKDLFLNTQKHWFGPGVDNNDLFYVDAVVDKNIITIS